MQTSRSSLTAIRRPAQQWVLLRTVAAVLACTLAGNSLADGQTAASPTATKQVLQQVGISKQVKVKELDGTTLKGTLTGVHDTSFELIPRNGGAPVTVDYSQVLQASRSGVPKALKTTLIVTAIVVVGIVVAAFITISHINLK